MLDTYYKIFDFISIAKKLEYQVLIDNKLISQKENIFFSLWHDKLIEPKGNILAFNQRFDYHFHGQGVSFNSLNRSINYNFVNTNIGIRFTVDQLYEYKIEEIPKNIETEFEILVSLKLIQKSEPYLGNSYFL